MRPPICAICEVDMMEMDNGGLVEFARSESDKKWDKRMEDENMVGHPPYLEWFCAMHKPKALELSHLTRPEAMALLKKFFSDSSK